MHVIICGSRHCGKTKEMQDLIDSLPEDCCVVVGGARGADFWAEKMALERGLDVKVFPADWKRNGKSAGFRRNVEMWEETWPEQVHCFFVDGEKNIGTQMMHNIADRNTKDLGLMTHIRDYHIDPLDGLKEIDL